MSTSDKNTTHPQAPGEAPAKRDADSASHPKAGQTADRTAKQPSASAGPSPTLDTAAPDTPARSKPLDPREQRLAAALRANLRKRKAAARPGSK
jgi:hypothetical protein